MKITTESHAWWSKTTISPQRRAKLISIPRSLGWIPAQFNSGTMARRLHWFYMRLLMTSFWPKSEDASWSSQHHAAVSDISSFQPCNAFVLKTAAARVENLLFPKSITEKCRMRAWSCNDSWFLGRWKTYNLLSIGKGREQTTSGCIHILSTSQLNQSQQKFLKIADSSHITVKHWP